MKSCYDNRLEVSRVIVVHTEVEALYMVFWADIIFVLRVLADAPTSERVQDRVSRRRDNHCTPWTTFPLDTLTSPRLHYMKAYNG